MVLPDRNDTNGMGLISMSERDLKRIQVLAEVRAGQRTVVSAAAVLDLGVRQTFRLLSRYEVGGAGALIHQARGRASNRQLSAGIREYAVELVRTKYADFGPRHSKHNQSENEGHLKHNVAKRQSYGLSHTPRTL